jgi:hypothetical protein
LRVRVMARRREAEPVIAKAVATNGGRPR